MSLIGLVPRVHLNTSNKPQLSTSKLEGPPGSGRSASHREPVAMLDVHSAKLESDGHSEDGICTKTQAPKEIIIKVIHIKNHKMHLE